MRTAVASRITIVLAALCITASQAVMAQSPNTLRARIKHGEYLANFGGCSDCHTPKIVTPNGPELDKTRLLSGHPANMPPPAVPAGVLAPNQWDVMSTDDMTTWVGPWGISFSANLTPDMVTGLGGWTQEQFIKTMRAGKHLGVGRDLLPPMPWSDIGLLTDKDLKALFAYLKSLKPIANQVPAPIPPK
jgi:hypothetical protein